MKIALGAVAVVLLAAGPAYSQSLSGQVTAEKIEAQLLPYTPPSNPGQTVVSGGNDGFTPSTFVTFEAAVAVGNVEIKSEARTVAQAAAESRAAAKIHIVQDNHDNVILSEK